ncbi:MAG: winged helix-turn-helix transcriptional regulator [Promethearchaeota archaeon]
MIGNKKRNTILLSITIFFIGFNMVFSHGLPIDIDIPGLSYQGLITPDDDFSLNFLHNIHFKIKTDVDVNLSIDFQSLIFNRQASININNSNPISLNITVKFNPSQFFSNLPDDPKLNDTELIFRYNCIYRYVANSSIERITLQFSKLPLSGLSPDKNYIIVAYYANLTSWEPLITEEKIYNSTSESYLEASITNLESHTPYFVTVYEISDEVIPASYDWLWFIILPVVVILIALLIVISKEDYINYIKNRITPIEKGFHRLTLQDVLDNENRDKIIDFILKKPGTHFNELLRKTKLSPGNLVWHLDILEKYKVIKKQRFEHYVIYFPYYQSNPISNLDLKLQKSELTLKVLEMIEKEPGIWNNSITKKMKINRKTIQYHIKKLSDLGLIYSEKTGNKKKLFLKSDSDYFSNNNDF